MLRSVLSLLLTGLVFLSTIHVASAQDRGRQARDVDTFTKIALDVPGTLHLRQGERHSLEIEASQEVLDHLETTVEDGSLKIRDDSNFFDRLFGSRDEVDVEFYVTAPVLEAISVAGAGRIVGETAIEGETLALNNAGAGDIDLEVDVEDLNMNLAGSGTLHLRGTADGVSVRIAGSGSVRALDLTTPTADIEVAGSGDTRLHVTNQLSASIMGSGDVQYRGSPQVDTSIMGSGKVRSVE